MKIFTCRSQPLAPFAREAANLAQRCNISATCQSDYDADDTEFPFNYDDTYPSYYDYGDDSDEYDSEYYGGDGESSVDQTTQDENEVTNSDIQQLENGNEIIPENTEATQQNYDSEEEQEIVNNEGDQTGEETGLNAGSVSNIYLLNIELISALEEVKAVYIFLLRLLLYDLTKFYSGWLHACRSLSEIWKFSGSARPCFIYSVDCVDFYKHENDCLVSLDPRIILDPGRLVFLDKG